MQGELIPSQEHLQHLQEAKDTIEELFDEIEQASTDSKKAIEKSLQNEKKLQEFNEEKNAIVVKLDNLTYRQSQIQNDGQKWSRDNQAALDKADKIEKRMDEHQETIQQLYSLVDSLKNEIEQLRNELQTTKDIIDETQNKVGRYQASLLGRRSQR